MDILNKINTFLNEDEVGTKPIQFLKWWNDFRPGDRCDVQFGNDYTTIVGTNANGNFTGVTKEVELDNKKDMEKFKSLERDVWDYC